MTFPSGSIESGDEEAAVQRQFVAPAVGGPLERRFIDMDRRGRGGLPGGLNGACASASTATAASISFRYQPVPEISATGLGVIAADRGVGVGRTHPERPLLAIEVRSKAIDQRRGDLEEIHVDQGEAGLPDLDGHSARRQRRRGRAGPRGRRVACDGNRVGGVIAAVPAPTRSSPRSLER